MKKSLLACLLLGVLLFSYNVTLAQKAKSGKMTKNVSATAVQPVEFADPKYVEMGKQRLQQFQTGDIDTWAGQFTDNAVSVSSGGDSLVGKQAIIDYWKNRRANVIESITFSNDIWLPVKINRPQRGPDMPGVWLLVWYQFNAKYKNGKSVTGWIHQDFHFNNDGKIDRMITYMDRAPILSATGNQ